MKMLRRMVHTARSTSAPALSLSTRRYRTRGVTLIELMIALGFGLVLILATLSIYLANKQTFRQVENLARLNENARIAFELLGREFREAGATPCGNSQVSNILENPSAINWGGTQKGITPYGKTQVLPAKDFGTGTAQRVSGTDAVVISTGSSDMGISVESHNANAASLKLNKLGSGFSDGEIILACDFRFATIFEISNVQSTNVTLVHNTGNSSYPGEGNCTKVLYKAGEQVSCSSTNGDPINGATIVKVTSTSWYIANNGRGGRSLYRIATPSVTPEEMVENVTNMELEYLVEDAVESEPFDYVISTNYNTTSGTMPRPKGSTSSSTYTWWPSSFNPIATRITLTLQTPEAVGTNSQRLSRQVSTVFSLRNQIF